MTKNKRVKQTKKEILKAQGKIGEEIVAKKVTNNYELPLNQIKKDLFKTSLFAVLSLAVILFLAKTNTGYQTVLNIIQSKF